MSIFDLFILPSLQEGFGNVVLEAMATSKPVITTENVGCANLFKHKENIWIIKPADHRSIANAIIELYNNKRLRETIASNAKEYIKNNFNFNSWVNQYISIFNKYGNDVAVILLKDSLCLYSLPTNHVAISGG